MTSRPLLVVPLVALLAVSAGQSQVAHLAPPDSVLSVSVRTGSAPTIDLGRELAALDWQGAQRTLQALAGQGQADLPAQAILGAGAGLLGGNGGALAAAFASACPQLPESVPSFFAAVSQEPEFELLLAVELPADRLPAAILAVTFAGPDEAGYRALASALGECLESEGATLVTGYPVDERIFQLDEGFDGGTAVTIADRLVIVGSSPETVAAALERSATAADSRAAAASTRFETGVPALSITIRPATMGGWLKPWMTEMPGTAAGPGKLLLGLLADIETFALQVGVSEEGIVAESEIAFDPERQDSALAELLLCRQCRAPRPYLAPADAVGVASGPLPLRELTAFVDTWFGALGEDSDLQRLALDRFGLDLENDLLAWLGDRAHLVALEPPSSDLRTLLFAAPQVLLVPVSSVDSAQAAIERLALAVADGEGALGDLALAMRRAEYRDVPYLRLQASLNVDVAITVIGGHLAIATPARALEPIVDTFRGAPGIVGQPYYRRALEAAPAEANAITFQDTSVQLAGLASIAELLAQPLAFGLDMLVGSQSSDGMEYGGGWIVDLEGHEAQPVSADGEPLLAELHADGPEGTADAWIDGELSDLYRLDVQAGQRLTVVMESYEFDTMLHLVEGDTGVLLQSNDDAPDTTRSELGFTVEPGVDYLIQATSFGGDQTGSYLLTVESLALAHEAPDFADLLALAELPARTLQVLADRLGISFGYSVVEENALYTRTVTTFRR